MRFVNFCLILPYFGVGMACKLSGDWVNEKGSNLTIVVDNGVVSGTFTTAVESKPGAAGGTRPITGWADSSTNLISFAVMFKESTVVFTGQCYTKSDGKDLLWTSWILKSKADSCQKHWMKNTIGEDRFTRIGAEQGSQNGPCGS